MSGTGPKPEQPLSSSPADPSSRAPRSGSPSGPSHSSPFESNTGNSTKPRHVLLYSELLDVRLKVNVNGGGFSKKLLTASVQQGHKDLIIRRTVYKTSTYLEEEWVTPKHPNPTRDNGLLIVIKGEHRGKYVRRIHHRYEAGKAIVRFAVVHREKGHTDKLTGEELELDVSNLCLCEESQVDKRLNRSLMNELREEARKTRAK